MKKYNLKPYGNLFYTTGTLKGDSEIISCNLLVDTGSTYTILPWEILYNIGCDPTKSREKIRVITASGYVLAPKVKLQWIHSLGSRFEDFQVLCHTMPPTFYVDGILGMDFLKKAKVHFHIFEGQITTDG